MTRPPSIIQVNKQFPTMPTNCNIEVHQLLNKPLSKHAWNSDKTSNIYFISVFLKNILEVAVCPNSENVIVLRREGLKWIVEDILKEVKDLLIFISYQIIIIIDSMTN